MRGVHGYEISRDDYLKRLVRIVGLVRGVARMVTEDNHTHVLTHVDAMSAVPKGVAVGLLDEHVRPRGRGTAEAGNRRRADQKVAEVTRAIERRVCS